MSRDQHPVNDLLSPYIDPQKQEAYRKLISSLRCLSVEELYEKHLQSTSKSWQWWAVMDEIRLALAVLTEWDEVVEFRKLVAIQSMVDDRLRQIVAKQSTDWLLLFLTSATTPWTQDFLGDELRTRIDAIDLSKPIPDWFTNALSQAREQDSPHLGMLEKKAMQLMLIEVLFNVAD